MRSGSAAPRLDLDLALGADNAIVDDEEDSVERVMAAQRLSRRGTRRHQTARPAVELHHAPGLCWPAAHHDRQAVRDEPGDD
jgi:hypothetical protein